MEHPSFVINPSVQRWDQLPMGRRRLPNGYRLSYRHQEIWCYGLRHSHDPESEKPQWDDLREKFGAWLKRTDPEKREVVVEGAPRKALADLREAIIQGGEIGLMEHLAAYMDPEHSVPIVCVEMPRFEVLDLLARQHGFLTEEIFFYEVAGEIVGWDRRRSNDPSSLEDTVASSCRRLRANLHDRSAWQGFDFSFNHAREIHHTLFPEHTFTLDDRRFIEQADSLIEPNGQGAVTNRVALYQDLIRNTHIVERLADDVVQNSYSAFVSYGGSHPPCWRAALEQKLHVRARPLPDLERSR